MFKFSKKIIYSISFLLAFNFVFAQTQNEEGNISPIESLIVVESIYTHELNPQVTSMSSDAQILTGLYEGLFSYNPQSLAPEYAIAVDYRISRDKKRWTFTINPQAKFSNGQKITAQDVKDSWLQLLATPNAPYASMLDVISGAAEYRNGTGRAEDVAIYANSEESLTIHLNKPANYLPKVLCHSAFSVINRNPTVYSGPFYMADIQDGVYIMQKNPYYWDSKNVALKEIIFIQSDDDVENAYYFNTGYVDWVTDNIDTSLLLDKKSFQLNAEFATNYLFFKNNDTVWSNPEFRTALFEAIPWDVLRKDCYVPATTFVYPLTGYPAVDGYDYTDSAEAKNLMVFARKKYNISLDEKIPLVIEIPQNYLSQEKLTALCDAWENLGVDVQIKFVSSKTYFNGVTSSKSDVFMYTWIGDFADPLAFLEMFRSDSTLNDARWSNKEYDDLLEQAALVSEEERYRLLGEAEKLLLDNCIVIPIQHPVTYSIIDTDCVGGWYSNAFDIHPLKYLYKNQEKSTVPNIVMNK